MSISLPLFAPKNPMLSGMPAVVSIDKNNNCKILIDNCAPYDVTIERNDIIGLMDKETDQLQLLDDATISAVLSDIDKKLPKVPKSKFTKEDIAAKAHLDVPKEYKQKYIDILYKHQKAISVNKYDLGLAKNFKYKIHLKDNNPVYRKQFKISEAHQNFIEQTLKNGLSLELSNAPIHCITRPFFASQKNKAKA
jgi:hypothetical protein